MAGDYDFNATEHLFRNRIVHLAGDITTDVAAYVVDRLLVFDAIDPEREIRLYVSSYGGSVYAGLAIYDAMMMIDAPVSTLCVGASFSMAAVLVAAGTKGRRFATPSSRLMIHQPSTSMTGTTSDIRVAAENVLQLERELCEILARHSGRPAEEISAAMTRDLWLTPQAAIDLGLIDGVAPRSGRKG